MPQVTYKYHKNLDKYQNIRNLKYLFLKYQNKESLDLYWSFLCVAIFMIFDWCRNVCFPEGYKVQYIYKNVELREFNGCIIFYINHCGQLSLLTLWLVSCLIPLIFPMLLKIKRHEFVYSFLFLELWVQLQCSAITSHSVYSFTTAIAQLIHYKRTMKRIRRVLIVYMICNGSCRLSVCPAGTVSWNNNCWVRWRWYDDDCCHC